jgi:crotonobetainyl-CoA:carnitine CoA-transferase CaiB-like acyl-CoA transferase
MATMILASLGANVVKIENLDIGADPFQDIQYLEHAPHFEDWYNNLNENKDVLQLSFSKNKEKLEELLNSAHIILIPDVKFFNQMFENLSLQNKAIIKLSGGKGEWKALHDLNALALTRSFKFHCKESSLPPYLPFAGISYAQYLSTACLGILRKVEKSNKTHSETIYLKEVTDFILDSLHSEQVTSPNKFLHNGAFPCYQMYKTSDAKTVCLAAVEGKYWRNFTELFKLDIIEDQRFDASGKTTETLKNMFANLSSDEIRSMTKNTELCLTIATN